MSLIDERRSRKSVDVIGLEDILMLLCFSGEFIIQLLLVCFLCISKYDSNDSVNCSIDT